MELKNEVIDKIIERLSLSLGGGEYTDKTVLSDLELKSANYVQITTALEDEFDVEIPYMDFKRKSTVEEAAEYVVHLIEG